MVHMYTMEHDIEDLDLLESESEDKDYERRRRAGVQSRTREIADRLQWFYEDMNRDTSFSLDSSTSEGNEKGGC